MLIAFGAVIAGLLVLVIRQQLLKRQYIKEKGTIERLLYITGTGLTIAMLPLFLYEFTDTFWEWLLSDLLVAAILGVEILGGRGIRKLKYNFWIIPAVGIIGIIGVSILNKLIISGTTGILTGVLAGLICQASTHKEEEELRHGKLILIEAIVICFFVVWGMNSTDLETKPARIIREQLTDIPRNYVKIKVTQGEKLARRGEAGEFRVFIENEDGRLEELREYTYFKGKAELISKQIFN